MSAANGRVGGDPERQKRPCLHPLRAVLTKDSILHLRTSVLACDGYPLAMNTLNVVTNSVALTIALCASSFSLEAQAPVPAPQAVSVQQATEQALVTPPQPLRTVTPNLRSIGPWLYETTSIDVQVSIDAAGGVVEAHPINTGKKINQAVVREAVKAAMQWTFQPATYRGKAIPATHVITFRFPSRS